MAGAKRGRGPRQGRGLEIKVSGRHACRALWDRRPETIIRVYIEEGTIPEFGDLLKYCATHRLAYHVVDAEELERVSATRHHEGVCLLAHRVDVRLSHVLGDLPERIVLLALDGIDNPHNLGAILRTAAHYGVAGVMIEGEGDLTPAAHRVAEGGAAWVDVIGVPSLSEALERCKNAGFRAVGTTGRGHRTVFEERFPPRTVIVLGNERLGMSRPVERACNANVRLPGTKHVESLNVSAACAAVLTEIWRQGEEGAAAPGRR